MAKPMFILNGPNLNMLGTREPEIYGSQTLKDIGALCVERAKALGHTIELRQTNHEGEMVEWIQQARSHACGVIINPAALTHTSVAVHDALRICDVPVIELHLSNPHTREAFRHHSFVSPVANGVIAGFGGHGYVLAVEALAGILSNINQ